MVDSKYTYGGRQPLEQYQLGNAMGSQPQQTSFLDDVGNWMSENPNSLRDILLTAGEIAAGGDPTLTAAARLGREFGQNRQYARAQSKIGKALREVSEYAMRTPGAKFTVDENNKIRLDFDRAKMAEYMNPSNTPKPVTFTDDEMVGLNPQQTNSLTSSLSNVNAQIPTIDQNRLATMMGMYGQQQEAERSEADLTLKRDTLGEQKRHSQVIEELTKSENLANAKYKSASLGQQAAEARAMAQYRTESLQQQRAEAKAMADYREKSLQQEKEMADLQRKFLSGESKLDREAKVAIAKEEYKKEIAKTAAVGDKDTRKALVDIWESFGYAPTDDGKIIPKKAMTFSVGFNTNMKNYGQSTRQVFLPDEEKLIHFDINNLESIVLAFGTNDIGTISTIMHQNGIPVEDIKKALGAK